MNADKTLNDILVKLFNDLMEIEEKCLISGEFMNISGNDMHIIEALVWMNQSGCRKWRRR